MIPDDYAAGFNVSMHSFGKHAKFPHPCMNEPFDPVLRKNLKNAVSQAACRYSAQGLYIYNNPDHLESSAEGRALARLFVGEKNRVVGSTAGPELILAKEMGIPYALLCSVANYVQGITSAHVNHGAVLSEMSSAKKYLLSVIEWLIKAHNLPSKQHE